VGYIEELRSRVGHDCIKIPGGRAILADSEGKILLQKRTDFGTWGLPAGSADGEESATESIIREVYEETGLIVDEPIPIAFSSNPEHEILTYPNGDVVHCYSLIFLCHTWSGTMITSNEETEELAFFAPDDLPEMVPNMRRSIELYLAHLATGQFQID
jgi:8-oxo-dGTP pyrophosphatase MutT (NUDIX family)